MVKLKKEVVTKTYVNDGVISETIMQFNYDTRKEREEHKKEMEARGWEDSEQVREHTGSIMNDEYVWFGSYHKREGIPFFNCN